MTKKKYAYNYNLEECDRLMKKGISPIGCGINPSTNSVYHVFNPTRVYFGILDLVRIELADNHLSKDYVQNCTESC